MKKTRLILLLPLVLLLLAPLAAKAYIIESRNSVIIPKDRVVDTNLYTAGAIITIDGDVKGDVFCAGQAITINGKVDGDVICAGQSIEINGEVGGNVRVAGNTININNKVARNAMAFGSAISLGDKARVNWDFLTAGVSANIKGAVGGDLHGAAGNVVISGTIGKNVKMVIGENMQTETRGVELGVETGPALTITKSATINGSLNYTASDDAKVEEGAKIMGDVKRSEFKVSPGAREGKRAVIGFWAIASLFGALVVGLCMASIWRKQIIDITKDMQVNIAPAIGWGFVLMFVAPIAVMILLFTIIGIPLAMILLAFWFVAIYAGKILAGIFIGRNLYERWSKQKNGSLILPMIIGVALVWIVCWIPVIGWLFCLVMTWWGLGGLWRHIKIFH